MPGIARNIAEMRFAASLQPCPSCGSDAAPKLDLYGQESTWQLVGKCPACSAGRHFVFQTEGDPLGKSYDRLELGDGRPSQVIQPHQFLAELDRLEGNLLDDPRVIDVGSWPARSDETNRAAIALNELLKFVPAGESAIPDSALDDADRASRSERPERYTRTWLEGYRDRMFARAQRFVSDAPRSWAIRNGGTLHISEELRGLFNQVPHVGPTRLPTTDELRGYLDARAKFVKRETCVSSIRALDADGDMHVELLVHDVTGKDVEEATGPLSWAATTASGTKQVNGQSVLVKLEHQDRAVRRITVHFKPTN